MHSQMITNLPLSNNNPFNLLNTSKQQLNLLLSIGDIICRIKCKKILLSNNKQATTYVFGTVNFAKEFLEVHWL